MIQLISLVKIDLDYDNKKDANIYARLGLLSIVITNE